MYSFEYRDRWVRSCCRERCNWTSDYVRLQMVARWRWRKHFKIVHKTP